MYTDRPLVVCAPTGSGKTVIFELAIIRLLMNSGQGTTKAKVVYSKCFACNTPEQVDEHYKSLNTETGQKNAWKLFTGSFFSRPQITF